MTAVALLLRKDLTVLRRSPLLLGALLAYPVVIALLVGLVAGYASSKPRVAYVDEDNVPYFSLAMLPGGRRPQQQALRAGTVAVVGLGPGAIDWMTTQSRRELAAATDLIGYGGYLDRVPVRDGQRRHPSDNTDEPARARLACAGL